MNSGQLFSVINAFIQNVYLFFTFLLVPVELWEACDVSITSFLMYQNGGISVIELSSNLGTENIYKTRTNIVTWFLRRRLCEQSYKVYFPRGVTSEFQKVGTTALGTVHLQERLG